MQRIWDNQVDVGVIPTLSKWVPFALSDMTTADTVQTGHPDPEVTGNSVTAPQDRELFEAGRTSRSKVIGLVTVIILLVSAAITFALLMDLTPIEPSIHAVIGAAVLNGLLILVLIFLIGKEVIKIIRSRRKERAASRLHVRIIGLFCLVAAFPAILVAIAAGITLDLGLDRWFESRTKKIVESSVNIARAYKNESTRVMMGNTLSMAANLDRSRRIYVLDREGFKRLFAIETRGRGFLAAFLVDENGKELVSHKLHSELEFPPLPDLALELAKKGEPVPIPSANNNLISAVFKLREIQNAYLYSIISIPPGVIEALDETTLNSDVYTALEQNRLPFQLTFALLYLAICLVVLLSAIWMGISVANRIVTPIRRLMFAADKVSDGDLDARVDLRQSEGDLRFLSETFNVMLSDLKQQQGELVSAKELMDQRARFIEAVLSGVSSAVIGLDSEGKITIANKSALPLLQLSEDGLKQPMLLSQRVPKLGKVFDNAIQSNRPQHLEQITLLHEGRERTLNVQVTVEEEETPTHSFVMTLDDITDLVAAQRNTAWADVARRIAHEIKNPLTPIQLSAERIKRRYGKVIENDREVFDNCTDTIIRQVGDIGRMVDEFSAFARMPKPEMAVGDLRNILKDTVFLQKVGFPDIEFELDTSKEPLEAVFDSRLLSQAMINIIKNAAEAIEGVSEDADGKIVVRAYPDVSNAIIEVIDNGKGLPETNRQRLLEPYMTTREKGTGLGLAIVRKICEDHGGTVDLLDAPSVCEGGTGAMTRITIPLASQRGDEPDGPIDKDNVLPERV
ncbi:MAG: PAS domain-containing sensor histidine kinase [Pseudomonadota bacterium]